MVVLNRLPQNSNIFKYWCCKPLRENLHALPIVICLFSLPPSQSIFHKIHPFTHFLPQYPSPNSKQMEPGQKICLQWYWGNKGELQGIKRNSNARNTDGAFPNPRPMVARSKEWWKIGNRVSLRGKMIPRQETHPSLRQLFRKDLGEYIFWSHPPPSLLIGFTYSASPLLLLLLSRFSRVQLCATP